MQNLNIAFVRYFVTVVDCNKFSTAALRLHVSQPALSKGIQLLERELGVTLLKRYPRGFSLTEAGKFFYEASLDFLKTYDDYLSNVERRAFSPYSGTVRLSASSVIFSSFFTQILINLREKYPDIRIFAREEDAGQTIQSLLDRKVDFGITVVPLAADVAGRFTSIPILRSTLHVVCPADHALAGDNIIQVRDLEPQPLLVPSEFSWIHQRFVKLCETNGFSPNIMCSCSDMHFLLNLTKAGIGLAVLPGALLQDIPNGLVHLPLVPMQDWELAMLLPNVPRPPVVNATVRYIQDYFSSRMPIALPYE